MGVAVVSAYEAYAINVTAQVANAVNVSATSGTTLGTSGDPASPLRWRNIPIQVSLSTSFIGQGRVSMVAYRVCAAPKPNTHPGTPNTPLSPFEFFWMGGTSFIEMDPLELPLPSPPDTGPFHWIGPTTDITPPVGAVCPAGAANALTNPSDLTDTVYLWLDVQAFETIYNPVVDDLFDKLRNDFAFCGLKGLGQPCVIMPVPPADTNGTTLGLDLVIQVTDIN